MTEQGEQPARGWIDITIPIEPSLPTFQGDPPLRMERASSLAAGDVANVTRLDFGVHTGTHIDAPVHFIEGGLGADAVPLDALIGEALVIDATGSTGVIDRATLEGLGIPAGEQRLIFKTGNSRLWDAPTFSTSFIGLDEQAARMLVASGARLVGIDYLSIAPFGDPTPTHRALLEARVVILEGLDLRAVEPGPYDLLCLPLRIVGCDGGPARALLRPR